MRIQITKVAVVLWAIMTPITVFCQSKLQSGIFLGGANYQGDLVETLPPYPGETRFGIGITNHYSLSPYFKLRGQLFFGKIGGTDLNSSEEGGRRRRNFSFESSIGELALMLEWSPFAMTRDSLSVARPRSISPYLVAGLGVARFNAKNSFDTTVGNGFIQKIEKDKSAMAEQGANLVIPITGGLLFNISKSLELGLEGGARMTFTDYVDGVSVSGNPDVNDWYWFAGANLRIRFQPKDSDRDGIIDKEDNCPKEEGGLETNGCPDTDGDGIGDTADLCPNIFGLPAFNGCPDTDGDGVEDVLDDCPELAGVASTGGCPDQDLDAIPDLADDCPKLAGTLLGNGCPLFDLNGNGTIEDEMEIQYSKYSKFSQQLKKQRSKYQWLKSTRIWSLIKW